jgi:hypothetical protein
MMPSREYDSADALLRNTSRDAHHLEALADAALGIADATLLDAHQGQALERLLVGDRPCDSLAEAVHLPLRRPLECPHRRPATSDQVIDVSGLFRGDRSRHRDLPPSDRSPAAPGKPSISVPLS